MNPEKTTIGNELPVIKAPEARCVGCVFTRVDVEKSPALRNLLAAEGCLDDCPILRQPRPPSSPVFPAHKSLS